MFSDPRIVDAAAPAWAPSLNVTMVGLVNGFRVWSSLRIKGEIKETIAVVFCVLEPVSVFWEMHFFGLSSYIALSYIFRCGYEGETLFTIQQVFRDQRRLIVVPWVISGGTRTPDSICSRADITQILERTGAVDRSLNMCKNLQLPQKRSPVNAFTFEFARYGSRLRVHRFSS